MPTLVLTGRSVGATPRRVIPTRSHASRSRVRPQSARPARASRSHQLVAPSGRDARSNGPAANGAASSWTSRAASQHAHHHVRAQGRRSSLSGALAQPRAVMQRPRRATQRPKSAAGPRRESERGHHWMSGSESITSRLRRTEHELAVEREHRLRAEIEAATNLRHAKQLQHQLAATGATPTTPRMRASFVAPSRGPAAATPRAPSSHDRGTLANAARLASGVAASRDSVSAKAVPNPGERQPNGAAAANRSSPRHVSARSVSRGQLSSGAPTSAWAATQPSSRVGSVATGSSHPVHHGQPSKPPAAALHLNLTAPSSHASSAVERSSRGSGGHSVHGHTSTVVSNRQPLSAASLGTGRSSLSATSANTSGSRLSVRDSTKFRLLKQLLSDSHRSHVTSTRRHRPTPDSHSRTERHAKAPRAKRKPAVPRQRRKRAPAKRSTARGKADPPASRLALTTSGAAQQEALQKPALLSKPDPLPPVLEWGGPGGTVKLATRGELKRVEKLVVGNTVLMLDGLDNVYNDLAPKRVPPSGAKRRSGKILVDGCQTLMCEQRGAER